MNLGSRLGLSIMNVGLGLGLYLVKGLCSLRYNVCNHFWIALYNNGLLQKVLLQILLNVHFCVLLHMGASIDFHMYSDILMPVSLKHLWSGTRPSPVGSTTAWSSLSRVVYGKRLLFFRA